MTLVKRALFRYPDGREIPFSLVKREKGDFRWIYAASGEEVSGVAYLSEADAVKAMRVKVDHEPELVGVDLTILSVEDPPEVRAAQACIDKLNKADQCWGPDDVFLPDQDKWRDDLAAIIAAETNVSPLITSFSDLMAYVFRHRPAFAKALFPVTEQGSPRDMVLDGLLLIAIEAIKKSTKQDLGNLVAILKQPVKQIIGAKSMPKKGTNIQ